ncbi:MAG: PolC-type DNA polymerase III [Lachnospiraceae bacterium]|nr:PolC-type DNA polymerase III [Lachnospiraceae bacterium]
MDKTLSEVFPKLVSDEKKRIFEDTVVTKVASTKDRRVIRVYTKFPGIVSKRRVKKLENSILKTYFPNAGVEVRVIETFSLSDAYTPKMAYKEYKDSMLEEVRDRDKLLYVIFKNSKFDFVDDKHLVLEVPNTGIENMYENDLVAYLHKVFCDRCGFECIIDTKFVEKESGELLAQNEAMFQSKLSELSQRFINSMNEEKSEESSSKEESSKESSDSSNHYQKGKGDFKKGKGDFKRSFSMVRSSNPNVIYGRDNDEEPISIDTILDEIGMVTIHGKVITLEEKPIRNERTILTFGIYDGTDSINCKIFISDEDKGALLEKLHTGIFVKIHGSVILDTWDKELSINSIKSIMLIPDYTTHRSDNSIEKRVELHCHTKMSDMDAVSNASDIIKQAHHFGHKAIAITDHGVVQAFPEAYHTVDGMDDMKVIYGIEAYLVDDEKKIVTNPKDQNLDSSFVVFDLETTGFNSDKDKIIEIGAVRFEGGNITDRFSEFVNPNQPIPYRITELTSIDDSMVKDAPPIEEILPRFIEFCEGAVTVAHNAEFDMSFIRSYCKKLGLECPETYMDTVEMARMALPNLSNYKLDRVAKALNVSLENHHRAVDDAECTAHIFEKLCEDFKNRGLYSLNDIDGASELSDEAIRKLHQYHIILLAKNDIGRINLYRLCSASHLKYFRKVAKLPKSLIRKYREGLIIGSACSAGELYEAVLNGRPEEKIREIASFYDYLEVQPIGNDRYLIADEKSGIEDEEGLRDIVRKIYKLGRDLKKPVVATCDVHFLNPEDEIYRRIIQAGKGFKDADQQPPLYLHTTEEMLEEFSFLGSDIAKEIVISNTNLIADMCDTIAPVRPDKCPPVIENSDGMLREICYNRAHELYGEDLPEVVVARLERELNSIISNGYAVMYIIAQKLVWKSVEDGYLVGSRGSVGSSFVATMSGITEVNPLSAHYVCPDCHYVDFDSEDVKKYSTKGESGCDMPDKKCPRCGAYLKKDGFDIPFETFLGFKGNKEPDIDLNFSGDYQGKAHRYTEVIFGEGQTFKAGTVGTLADKTAFGYIKKYYEEKGIAKRNVEIDRIVQGCVGVRRTTGQHPGGIIVLPMGEEINTFTPVQHPADDISSDVITTHFDYHSIDSNLLKLDILGHDDPTMIRMLEDLTGLDATTIPLDDKGVMSLFMGTAALDLKAKLWKADMGTLGIPEFGTDFAMGLLKDAKPKEFSDLIRISGLSHGTDVWQGNAEVLIKEGVCTISTAICCRDDIMVYLINQGLDSEESFTIMERVRKGVVAKGKCKEWDMYKEHMKEHGVPDWYIGSCEKIKYMFPKAHAAAYVMMAWRVAYCKVYYPLAYYAAFFSIRATAFNYELMCRGKDILESFLKEYDSKDKLSATEKDTYRDMRIVHEMYCRGFEFMPIDLYQSDARYFKIVDGKLLPPFNTIPNMGDKAAESLQIAASRSKFLSKDDLRQRGKISKTNIEDMERLGIIQGLPENNQLSLFDLV